MSTTVAPSSSLPVRKKRLLPAIPAVTTSSWGEVARLVICAGVTIALLVGAAADDGGYDSVTWLGGAIGLVVLGVWARLVFGRAPSLGRWGRLALTGLGLYTAWSYASIMWAADKGAALLGADRALLYLVLFWLFAHLEFTRGRLERSMAAYLLGIGGVALAILAELATGPAPQLLIEGQLAAGLGYHNGTAALGTIGAAGSILAACSRSHRPLIRAGLSAGATACLEISLLAQSRGWLYTLPVILLILFVITPRRGRAAAWALIPALTALATLPWVLHGWALTDGTAGASHQTVAAADVTSARAALLSVLVSGAAAWLVARTQQRYVLSHRGRHAAKWLSRAALALGLAGAVAAAVVLLSSGRIVHGWHQFTTDAPLKSGVSRFTELGSGRYDMWRVAFHSFQHHPLGGLGQDNFAQAYLTARHTVEEPLWVHSLELRLLAHTGAVGAALFCAFLVCALVAYRRAARDGGRRLRLALATALVPLVVWVVHGSMDWFWELPALGGAAFAFLGAVVALEPGRVVFSAEPRRTAVRVAALASVLVVAGVALAALVPAYVGERALGQGRALTATNPSRALDELRLASQLEPLDSASFVVESGIQLRAGGGARALQLARDGLRRDPGAWFLWLEDGLAAGMAGHPGLERSALAHARALDPREPMIAVAQSRAGSRDPLTITQAAAALAARAQKKVAP